MSFWKRDKEMTVLKSTHPTDVVFSYTHRLTDAGNFISDWVADVWYGERSKQLLLKTREGRNYLYNHVPQYAYNSLVEAVKKGESVGHAMNNVKLAYGPSVHDGLTYKPVRFGAAEEAKVDDRLATTDATPECFGVEVVYLLDGKEQRMKTQTTPEKAVKDYLSAVKTMGLKAELLRVEILYQKPEFNA